MCIRDRTGGPNSCYEENSPTCSKELFELGIPVLGLCYGAQLMQHVLGGKAVSYTHLIAELIRQVQDRVEEKFGVRLETEVKRLGEF